MELVCVIMSANSAHVLLKSRTDANPNARLESIMSEMNSEQGNLEEQALKKWLVLLHAWAANCTIDIYPYTGHKILKFLHERVGWGWGK